MKTYICECCGKEHDGSYGSGRFCSKHCRAVYVGRKQCQLNSKLNAERQKIRNPVKEYSFACDKCGKTFIKKLKLTEYPKYLQKKHFCSSFCAHSREHSEEQRQKISESLKQKNANKPKKLKLPKQKTEYCALRKTVCLECGAEIYLYTTAETYCPNCRDNHPHAQKYNVYDADGNRIYGKPNARAVKYNRTDPDLKHTIYKTVNNINGKFYIGKHQTFNINDGYLGSGVVLEKAIKKYGKEHFHKEILFVFETEEEMNAKEKELVTRELINDPLCYNACLGGEGGDTWSCVGRRHTEETKQKIRESLIKKNHLKNKMCTS